MSTRRLPTEDLLPHPVDAWGALDFDRRGNAGNSIVLNPARPGDVAMGRGDPDTLWFDDLSGSLTGYELWLPHRPHGARRQRPVRDAAGIPGDPRRCLSLVRVRELINDDVERRRGAGDANLHYVDGLTLSGAEDAGNLPDDLHPNPAGYVRMGERFSPHLSGTIGA